MSLPRAPVERIMLNAGADRVSEDAVELLIGSMEELADELLMDARGLAYDDDRQVVSAEDIDEASER